MIEIESALELVLARTPELEAERVPLEETVGRVLRKDVLADLDSPPFDASAMDGYAVRPPASPEGFRCIGEIAAGSDEEFSLEVGECVRLFTGARVPASAERVVMQESTKRVGDFVQVLEADDASFIRKRGENSKRGELVVPAGRPLTPIDLAAVASCGEARPEVTRRARVLHIVTGREIVPPDQKPSGTQIRDSNSILVRSFLQSAGADLTTQLHVGDDPELAGEAIRESEADLIIISGGAAVGKFDYARQLLVDAGFELVFERINLRPGKPLIFGIRGRQLAFAVPGNPVSHWVVLELIVSVALRKLHGEENTGHRLLRGKLARDLTLRPDQRRTYWPSRVEVVDGEQVITPLRFVSSGDIMCLSGANALLPIAPGETSVPANMPVSFLFCSR